MGNAICKRVFCSKEVRILFLGLDAAGKTTAMYQLKLGEVVTTIPTIGFNVETLVHNNTTVTPASTHKSGRCRHMGGISANFADIGSTSGRCRQSSNNCRMYLLVEFTDENCLAVIPDNWCDGNSCALWPDVPNPTKMVIRKQIPGNNWKAYPIKEMYRNESYEKVRGKLKTAEMESDIATADDSTYDDQETRRSKRKRRQIDYSSSEDEEEEASAYSKSKLPKPPQTVFNSPHASSVLPGNKKTSPKVSTPTVQPSLARNFMQQSPTPLLPRDGVSHARDIRLFTTLEKIKASQEKQQGMLERIYTDLQLIKTSNQPCGNSSALSEEIIGLLPINNEEDLQSLEDLLEDKNTLSSMVSYLSVVGGKTFKDSVRRALRNVMTSSFAKNFNWYEKKGKKAFGKLVLASVLMKAVRKTNRDRTDSDVEFVAREWLRTAGDREGGRKRRSIVSPQVVESLSEEM